MDLKILNIASDTDNCRIIENHTHRSKLKNYLCGDEVIIELVVKDNIIIDFGYQGNSCAYCQASASLLSKISINNQKDAISKLCDEANFFFDRKINSINKQELLLKRLFTKKNLPRKECILLPFKTLKKIVSN